jgi:hypothetical protein
MLEDECGLHGFLVRGEEAEADHLRGPRVTRLVSLCQELAQQKRVGE